MRSHVFLFVAAAPLALSACDAPTSVESGVRTWEEEEAREDDDPDLDRSEKPSSDEDEAPEDDAHEGELREGEGPEGDGRGEGEPETEPQ